MKSVLNRCKISSDIILISILYSSQPSCLDKNGDFILARTDDLLLDKFTISNAMAMSVKLGIWEASLEKYIDEIEFVTEDLKRYKCHNYR